LIRAGKPPREKKFLNRENARIIIRKKKVPPPPPPQRKRRRAQEDRKDFKRIEGGKGGALS